MVGRLFSVLLAVSAFVACKTVDSAGLKDQESTAPRTAKCLLEGGVWMSAPGCLPLNEDGVSVTFQGQTCSTIAMCPAQPRVAVLLSCVEEFADPFIRIAIEERALDTVFARVTEGTEDGEEVVIGDVRVRARDGDESSVVWRSGNNRLRLDVRTEASGDVKATLSYRNRNGNLYTDALVCKEAP